jgi:hypothetical protein
MAVGHFGSSGRGGDFTFTVFEFMDLKLIEFSFGFGFALADIHWRPEIYYFE